MPTPPPTAQPAPEPSAAFAHEVDGLVYALDELPTRASRRTVVAVSLAGAGAEPDAPRLLDRVDLFAFRSRQRFARLVAGHFGREPDAVLGQLAAVVDAAERARAQAESPDPIALTPARRRRAADLLRRPDLLDEAAAAMGALGFVGEEALKRLAYLVATSRLLDRPLSALLSAPTSSGKSQLMRVLGRLLPPESCELLSRLTPQALFYAGPNALRHKVVMVDEHIGAQEAELSLRTLLSQGALTLRASPRPGAGPARPITVHGPISLLSGTTGGVEEESLSRCLELTLDESPEQTRRVQAAQGAAWAGAPRPEVELEPWRDAQRLLEPCDVVVPFAGRLRFPARTSRHRRDHDKLLGLVAAHALLYQRQRARDEHARIVATPADYAAVHGLVAGALAVDLDGLSPRAARTYATLAEAARPLTRREVARCQGWAYNTAKKGLAELVAQELASQLQPGPPARYALVARALLAGPGELLDPAELERPAETSTAPAAPRAVRGPEAA